MMPSTMFRFESRVRRLFARAMSDIRSAAFIRRALRELRAQALADGRGRSVRVYGLLEEATDWAIAWHTDGHRPWAAEVVRSLVREALNDAASGHGSLLFAAPVASRVCLH